MKLKYVKLKNFKSYPDQETKLDLDFHGVKLIVGDNGCLTGDTVISFNRAKRGFKTTLEKAYNSWNGITFQGSRGEWNKEIPTFVRSYKDDKKEISLHEIDDIVYSGEKEVFLLTLEDGKQIKATSSHEFLTINGWKRVDELNQDADYLAIDGCKKELEEKIADKEIYGILFHKFAKKTTWDESINSYKEYYRLPVHRLIFEAYENGLSLDEYIYILRNDPIKSSVLKMYSTDEYHIHHKDSNHYNNNIDNLELLNKNKHLKKHGKDNCKNFLTFNLGYSKLVSIQKTGIEKTYDIVCKDPYRNFSANGIIAHNSGKTTFFDSIIWGLYGKSMALADDVINWDTGKNCKVEVGFNIGSDVYSVIRYRNHEEQGNKLLFFRNIKNISQRTNADTQEKIDETIQISYQAMVSSVILSSELYTSFLRSKPSDRLKSLESILSLKDVNEYAKKIKKMREPLLEEITKLETDKIKLVSSSEVLTETVESYNEKVKSILLSLKSQKEELQKKVHNIEIRLNEFREINVDRELKSNEEFDRVEESNKIIKDTVEKERNRLKDVDSLSTEYNELKSQLEEIDKIDISRELLIIEKSDEISKSNKEIKDNIEKLNTKVVNYSHAEIRVIQLQKEVDRLNSEKGSLASNSEVCPVCKQAVKKELTEKLIQEKDSELESISKELFKFINEISEGKKNNDKIALAIKKLNDNIVKETQGSKYTKEFLSKVSSNRETIKNSMDLLAEKIKDYSSYNKEINERIKELNSGIVTGLKEPKHHTLFLENIKTKVGELELEAEEYRSEIIVIDTKAKSSYDKDYVSETKKNIATIKTKLSKIEKTLKAKKIEDNYFEVLSQVFSNKEVGFKKFFINKIIKIFNERINFYLPFFFEEDIEIVFDKELNEFIKRNGKEVNFNSFSSGQKTRFELAIAFAMFMLVKTFFSNTMNLLVFDEILDRNLDKKGFNSVIEILENLGKSSSIFVVSHQEFYKEKFSHHVQVKLDSDGFSYIYKEV